MSAPVVIRTLMTGPSKIPDMPVPQGWEQVPALGTGTGMQEMIKTTAVISPTSGLKERSFSDILRSRYSPKPTKGATRTNQTAAQLNGRIPSEICMA